MGFRLAVSYKPRGDQENAIAELTRGVREAEQHQVLLGVTGAGKTFTMAKIIEAFGRPSLVLAHNKTLAAQLYHEFKGFFPTNAVEYFVSYYDYYQPEAYIPSGDIYIEKEATINDELDKLRLSATKSLFERRDCVIVASVSCIYGLGSPEAYYGMLLMLEKGQKITREQALKSIEEELVMWHAELEKQGKLIEAQRLYQRTMFDLEMIREIGYCHGIENYSRHFSGRLPGEAPPTLLDYLPHDHMIFIDESHQTIPQLHGMYHGDRSRKEVLVGHGFRLPSGLDNRPLTFEEFEHRVNQVLYVSATPGPYELTKSAGVVVEQIIRPTGLLDPVVDLRPIKGQVDDLLNEIRKRVDVNERVLVTTLTKRMSEDLSEFYTEAGVKCAYLHSEVSTLDRVKILRDLRRGTYDALIGVNLLREGLDLPEVSLVAILDADKEGFLRSAGSLIQTIGRAARHLNGMAILYADSVTDSMKRAIGETDRRRAKQIEFNAKRGITPIGISKQVRDMIEGARDFQDVQTELKAAQEQARYESMSEKQLAREIKRLEKEMLDHARNLEFEKAAQARDRLAELRRSVFGASPEEPARAVG